MKGKASCIPVLFAALLALGAEAWARNAPDFSLPAADGRTVSLSSYRGKYVVVDFIQTTCPHCQKAGQVLQKLYAENAKRLMVIGIAANEPLGMPAIQQYMKDHGVTYPVVLGDLKVAQDYLGVTPQNPGFRVPVFFFISPAGEIVEERNAEHLADRDWYANMEQNLEASVRRMLPTDKPAAKARKAAPAATKKTSGASKKTAPVVKQP